MTHLAASWMILEMPSCAVRRCEILKRNLTIQRLMRRGCEVEAKRWPKLSAYQRACWSLARPTLTQYRPAEEFTGVAARSRSRVAMLLCLSILELTLSNYPRDILCSSNTNKSGLQLIYVENEVHIEFKGKFHLPCIGASGAAKALLTGI
jgi:hypothetical protein